MLGPAVAALGEMVRAACSKRRSLADLARVGGDVPLAGWRVSGRRPPSGWEWQGSQSSQGATELGFLGPTLGQMQGEATRRAGEPSGEGEEASSEGLGGYQSLTQTDTGGPAGQQLCWLSRRMGNFCGTRTTPRAAMLEHGVEDDEQFAHTSDQGHPFRFTGRQQLLVEVADDRVVTAGYHRSHIQARLYAIQAA